MILALDTASPTVSVAVLDPDHDRVLAQGSSTNPMKHGEELGPLVAAALAESGISRRDLTTIGVGVGPGPFTGLRVGLVTARTLGFVLDIPVLGICSLDVLAAEAADTGAVMGDFVVATDARRKEVYVAAYDADGRRLEGPVVVKPDAVATGGPVVGEGATLYPEAFPTPVGPARPSALWLARLIAEDGADLRRPDPMYLRRPDAETARPRKAVS